MNKINFNKPEKSNQKNKIKTISFVITPEIFKIESILKTTSTPNHNDQVGLILVIPGQRSPGKSIIKILLCILQAN